MIPLQSSTTSSLLNENSFQCAICGIHSRQDIEIIYSHQKTRSIEELKLSFCHACDNYSVWHKDIILYPDIVQVATPNKDLSESIKIDYLEAASIYNKSPRGAAALLRLAIQKLCKDLGEKGKDLNYDIAQLVKKGLPVEIQHALDIVRVIGNNSVHPGELNVQDDGEIVLNLFKLINIIAERMITHPKEIRNMYHNLPSNKIDAINKRGTSKST